MLKKKKKVHLGIRDREYNIKDDEYCFQIIFPEISIFIDEIF